MPKVDDDSVRYGHCYYRNLMIGIQGIKRSSKMVIQIQITITGRIGDLDHDQIMKNISDQDLDQDHSRGSPFECVEINVNALTSHSRIIGLKKLSSNTKEHELDS